jgi:hypothetical protein
METLAFTLYGIGAIAVTSAATLKLYAHAYARGYENGKHYGFSDGLNHARLKTVKPHNSSRKQMVAAV